MLVYTFRYGLVPHFRAVLHFGSLVAGEMGLTRQEIAFSGAALDRLLSVSVFPSSLIIVSHGMVSLRGKSVEMTISAVRL